MEEKRNRRPGKRDFRDQREERRELAEDMIEGRNALTEALKSGRTIDKVFVAAAEQFRIRCGVHYTWTHPDHVSCCWK